MLIQQKKILKRGEALGRLLLRPFEVFAARQTSGGFVLIAATIIALLWVNSSWAPYYLQFVHAHFSLGAENLRFDQSVHFWINEGLMTLFFFVVGLEIKREFLMGELSNSSHAVLPIATAIGGMILPASIYYFLNYNHPGLKGWAIPMATDIAFTLGALTLLGNRVPYSLKIMIAALAIVDDIGAVLVIALFYTDNLQLHFLMQAGLLFLLLVGFNFLGFRQVLPYLIVGALIWWTVYMSGVHATVAGLLTALAIPARSRCDTATFVNKAKQLLAVFEKPEQNKFTLYTNEQHQMAVRYLERLCRDVQTPSQRIENALHPWVVFVVVPIFALVNAGVALDWTKLGTVLENPVSPGIILGLVVGKQIGISLFAWLTVKSGLASLPKNVTFGQIYGGAILCGVGFTMSLFIANLSFSDPLLLESAKLSILIGSLISLVIGTLVLYSTSVPNEDQNGSEVRLRLDESSIDCSH